MFTDKNDLEQIPNWKSYLRRSNLTGKNSTTSSSKNNSMNSTENFTEMSSHNSFCFSWSHQLVWLEVYQNSYSDGILVKVYRCESIKFSKKGKYHVSPCLLITKTGLWRIIKTILFEIAIKCPSDNTWKTCKKDII